MSSIAFFIFQFLWFTLAWTLITYFVAWPWSKTLNLQQRLSLWVAPQMFRVLGVGLLVPNLSPDMPLSFAQPTAIADTATSILAVFSFVALHQGWRALLGRWKILTKEMGSW